jgi:hypothetical protein
MSDKLRFKHRDHRLKRSDGKKLARLLRRSEQAIARQERAR